MLMEPPTDSLPYSEVNEQAVLACCLTEPELVDEAATTLAPSNFYDLRHANLFEAMLELRSRGEPVQVITVRNYAMENFPQGVEAVGGISFLAGLPDTIPSTVGLPNYVAVVSRKARLRDIVMTAKGIISSAQDNSTGDDDAKLERAESDLLGLIQSSTERGGEVCLRDALAQAINEIETAFEADGGCTGIATGFPTLDRLTGGFHNGDYIVLAARPSMGKTSFAMSVAENVAISNGIPVGVFSMEMSAASLLKRMLSSQGGVDGHGLLTGSLTERDIHKITGASQRIVKSKLHLNEKSHLTPAALASQARRMVGRHGVKLIIVDYLGLMRCKAESRVQEVSMISASLKAMAKELNVPVLVLAQLNRNIEHQERKPRLSDLRDSGSIEQDADLVMFLHRQDPASNLIQVLIEKHRNGPTGGAELEFDKATTRFRNPEYFKPTDA